MKTTMAMGMAGLVAVAVVGGPRAAEAGQREWATAGKILTGVVVGGLLLDAHASTPPCTKVVYQRPVCAPSPRWSGHDRHSRSYAPPPRCEPPRPVCHAPVVRYEQQVTVVQPVQVTETVWIRNGNGSRTPVQLRKADGGLYIGPRGEYYLGLPDDDQLRPVYGL